MPTVFPVATTQRPTWEHLSFQPSDCQGTSLPNPHVSDFPIINSINQLDKASAKYQLETPTDFYSTFAKERLAGEICSVRHDENAATTSSHVTLERGERDVGLDSGSQREVGEGRTIEVEKSEELNMPVVELVKGSPVEVNRAEMEFSWELYLEEMNAYPVPPEAFQHVANSLVNDLKEGDYIEYAYPNETANQRKAFFWYVELLYARGPEILVRYFGLENHPEEVFWLDLLSAKVFPCGKADRGVYMCRPPKVVCKHRQYLGALMEESKKGLPSPTDAQMAQRGVCMKDRFKIDQMLMVIDDRQPLTIWPAIVRQNIGGRLQLEYWKSDGKMLWIFCTHPRLKSIRWAECRGLSCAPPEGVILEEEALMETKLLLEHFASQTMMVAVPDEACQVFLQLLPGFSKGDHVEFLHPRNKHQIYPAVISNVYPDGSMAVEILDFRPEGKRERIVKMCDSQSLDVLPIHWCKKNGVRLCKPPGWKADDGEFSWQRIVDEHAGTLALQKCFTHLTNLANPGFSRGMKLEVTNPSEEEELCTATVVKVISPLLWVHIDSYGQSSTHILTFKSTDMFPVGFCGSNDHPLKLPRLMTHGRRMATIRSPRLPGSLTPSKSPRSSQQEPDSPSKLKEKVVNGSNGNGDSVTLFVNAKCHCGPLMSNKKLVNLPRSIGPGSVQLVLQCTISALIGCGTRPAKLLQLIAASGDHPRSANWERVRIKAKIGGRRQTGMIDVVKNVSQVPDFLRNTCILYEACPNLITTEPLSGRCPERCHQFTKPDVKNAQIRRRFRRVKDIEDDVASPDVPMDDELEEPKRLRITTRSQDSDEAESPPGFDDDVMDSVEPSRAASVEILVPAKEAPVVSDPLNAVQPPLKKPKAEGGLEKNEKDEPRESSKDEAMSPSASESKDSDGIAAVRSDEQASGKENEVDAENTPDDGRLVDDTEHVMQFFKHPRQWTVEEVFTFFRRYLPVSGAPDIFKRESIDGDALLMMCASDLKYLNVPSHEIDFIGTLIERLVVSVYFTKGQRAPLYSNWK